MGGRNVKDVKVIVWGERRKAVKSHRIKALCPENTIDIP